jgi:hypothetical protein
MKGAAVSGTSPAASSLCGVLDGEFCTFSCWETL